jgi:hypothetical protein
VIASSVAANAAMLSKMHQVSTPAAASLARRSAIFTSVSELPAE